MNSANPCVSDYQGNELTHANAGRDVADGIDLPEARVIYLRNAACLEHGFG